MTPEHATKTIAIFDDSYAASLINYFGRSKPLLTKEQVKSLFGTPKTAIEVLTSKDGEWINVTPAMRVFLVARPDVLDVRVLARFRKPRRRMSHGEELAFLIQCVRRGPSLIERAKERIAVFAASRPTVKRILFYLHLKAEMVLDAIDRKCPHEMCGKPMRRHAIMPPESWHVLGSATHIVRRKINWSGVHYILTDDFELTSSVYNLGE